AAPAGRSWQDSRDKPVKPGEVAVIARFLPAVLLGENPVHRRPLGRAVLNGNPAARPQQPPRDPLDNPDRIEAVGAGVQRGRRLVLADLGRHDGADRYIRRGADHPGPPPLHARPHRAQITALPPHPPPPLPRPPPPPPPI